MESKQDPVAAGKGSFDLFNLSSRWASAWAESSSAAKTDEEEPSYLNTFNSSGMFQMVSMDKMSVQYVGSPQHFYDVGAVQANCPAPTRRIAYYFEMTVKNAGQKGQIAIGFTTKEFNLRRKPGWEANSCGYHGDDGYLYHGQEKGEPFGPKYTSDDTVGAGINYSTQEFFFTKNGELVGTVCKDIKGLLYPTIAVHGTNEEIVRSYLLHYGYQDTVNSFDVESGIMSPHIPTPQENGFHEQGDAYELSNRKILRQFIMNGDIDSVFRSLHEWYPQIMQIDTSVICFLLHSQRFIEYIRDVIALLAYEDPSKSCVGHLLHSGQREFVADAVNAMVLATSPGSKRTEDWAFSSLEKLLKQLTQCSLERRALYGEQGEVFDVHKVVHTRRSIV
ncbi:hypothetical protein KFK09_022907 [Dendrobium nobile]|uniref:Uncharacterized protein n=1 Tax=Dendrobium nobile TaxID=94219 RepID=A0A8T3AJZ9_DENNO|nr:hypothetical protein KFK09_022907 [Dendrobium nobile]